MADYKGIKGTKIQNFTADPPTTLEGQVWYDSTASTLQFHVSNVTSAWRTGNVMNTARHSPGGAGIQTSAIAFGGETPGAAVVDIAETYNGVSWTEVGDLNTARRELMVKQNYGMELLGVK